MVYPTQSSLAGAIVGLVELVATVIESLEAQGLLEPDAVQADLVAKFEVLMAEDEQAAVPIRLLLQRLDPRAPECNGSVDAEGV